MVSPTSSNTNTPPSPGPTSAGSNPSTNWPPPPPPNSVATIPPLFTVPPPPPPTEASYRARRNTLTHRGRSDSISSIGKRSNPPGFGDYLARIHEESPGRFFEAPTGVPDNTPQASHAGESTCSSPRSDRTNIYPTVLNLPRISERLEQLPPPAASRFSSPPSSIAGESSIGEPLMMAAPRRFPSGSAPKPNPPSPLSNMKEARVQIVEPAERGGVREGSDWAGDVVAEVGRGLTRLANLAVDDNKRDPTKSVHDHYKFRLGLLLNDQDQKFVYGNIDEVQPPSTAEPAPLSAATARRPPSVHANYVNWSEFKELKDRVDDLNRLVKQLTDMHSYSQKEISVLKTEVNNLKKAVSGSSDAKRIGSDKKENDTSKLI